MPVLTILVGLPALGALLVALLPKRLARPAALGASLATLGLALAAWARFDPTVPGAFALQDGPWPWIRDLGVSWALGLDGVGLVLVLVTAVLVPTALASDRTPGRAPAALLLLCESAVLGCFTALDLVLFYAFFEAMLLPVLLVLALWGGPGRLRAAVRVLLYTLAGSLPLLAAVAATWVHHRSATGVPSALLADLLATPVPTSWAPWLFAGFALAFAVKSAAVPLHGWLPDAYAEAPVGALVVLAGLLAKAGLFGFLRWALPLFPEAAIRAGPVLLALGALGVIYGGLMAWVQQDLKRVVAWTSVSHLALCLVGIGAGTPDALAGSAWLAAVHGLYVGALFLLVDLLEARSGRRGVDDFGGLGAMLPRFSFLLGLTVLAAIAVPGLAGFPGEILVIIGTWRVAPVAAVAGASGAVLGAVYLLRVLEKVCFGRPSETARVLVDLRPAPTLPLAVLGLLLVGLGVRPLVNVVTPATDRVAAALETARTVEAP
ncbi:MAG: NADH-quinone oxidoreductase subunit M [Deltaproteobacteria bacterium]|nr:NADH-quinone oxidoreductase subunit M [Deltaproteobacteria bacterium]